MKNSTLQGRFSETRHPGIIVLAAGLATSVLTLIIIYFVGKWSDGEFDLMNLYHAKILPTGAIIVGIAAGSGYGLLSWLTGAKISRLFLFLVVALQLCVYFGAQYIEYLQVMQQFKPEEQIPFWHYFDAITRSFCWVEHGKHSEPLGLWGYGLRVLQATGFSFGGLIAPLALMSQPYCEKCQRYMTKVHQCLIPASVKPRKFKKADEAGKAQFETEAKTAEDNANALLEELKTIATKQDAAAFTTFRDKCKPDEKETRKLPVRIKILLETCRSCRHGNIKVSSLAGAGDKIKETQLSSYPVNDDFVREVIKK